LAQVVVLGPGSSGPVYSWPLTPPNAAHGTMAIRYSQLVVMCAITASVAASTGQNVRGGHRMADTARVHVLSPVIGDAGTTALAANATASLTLQGREALRLLVADLSGSMGGRDLKTFVSKCVAHVKGLTATIDREYTDTHLKHVLMKECDLANHNPSQFSSGFKTDEACIDFAHKLTDARMHELDHGDANKKYTQFCQEYQEHLAEYMDSDDTSNDNPLSPKWWSVKTPSSRTCLWCLILLLFSCCCFGGAAHSDQGHSIGAALGCLIPTVILVYVLFFTNLLSKVRHGESVGGFCFLLSTWAAIQIIIGCCMLGCFVAGKTLHKNNNSRPVGR